MLNVKSRLDAWRDAEHRRDGLVLGSPERQEADEDLRTAEKAFHAEVAQVSARYAEAELQERSPWSAQLGRRTSVATAETGRRYCPLAPPTTEHDR